jgi:RNA-directed DNA polymerase
MKTYGNLFVKLCSMENLELAFKKARKRKTLKLYVIEFEARLSENLILLHEELVTKKYNLKPLNTFILRDPKTRKISVSDFRDRVVHHAICNVLEPIFESRFIYDSYANRKGKGVLAALKRFDQFKRKVSVNGQCLRGAHDANVVKGFVLKADIKHYFENVDHEKLISVISRSIRDKDVLELIWKVLRNHTCKVRGKGMPLGNLTSQFFANVYLNELDQFVKHKLKAKHYIRYVDDFIILHKSAKQLVEWKKAIDEFLNQELLLELHPQKSRIQPFGGGVDFLGFRCFYHFRLLRKKNIRKALRRLEDFGIALKEGKIEPSMILESIRGWNAYATHANTYKLRRYIMSKAIELVQKPCPNRTCQS